MVVARAIQQSNNKGLVHWLNACAATVTTPQELDAFMSHATAVVRLYAILVASLSDSSGSPQA